jgi:hypothetical protein
MTASSRCASCEPGADLKRRGARHHSRTMTVQQRMGRATQKLTRSRWLALLLALAAVGVANAQSRTIGTYTANYEVQYKGRRVGQAAFELAYDKTAEVYRFHSMTTATRLLRLIIPRPILEVSEFTVVAGGIQPLYFSLEDGSRKGEDSFALRFDWDDGVVRSEHAGRTIEIPLMRGALDRATLQVALRRDMLQGLDEREYLLVDEDSLRRYIVRAEGEDSIETAAGRFTTQRYVQTRPESTRRTVIWAAPELGFLPVRIEQRRDGATQTALLLESYELTSIAE